MKQGKTNKHLKTWRQSFFLKRKRAASRLEPATFSVLDKLSTNRATEAAQLGRPKFMQGKGHLSPDEQGTCTCTCTCTWTGASHTHTCTCTCIHTEQSMLHVQCTWDRLCKITFLGTFLQFWWREEVLGRLKLAVGSSHCVHLLHRPLPVLRELVVSLQSWEYGNTTHTVCACNVHDVNKLQLHVHVHMQIKTREGNLGEVRRQTVTGKNHWAASDGIRTHDHRVHLRMYKMISQ